MPAVPAVAAEPSTALDAATQVAEASPTLVTSSGLPLGGPPPEPGLLLPRTGVLGWIAQQQSDFYQALVRSLDALRTDWTAFWVLGGLSFLYGIFHAAGPGHGKVVISSYVLANEAEMRRGVLLSFLSAMLQSLVAIAFVLVAALLLGMARHGHERRRALDRRAVLCPHRPAGLVADRAQGVRPWPRAPCAGRSAGNLHAFAGHSAISAARPRPGGRRRAADQFSSWRGRDPMRMVACRVMPIMGTVTATRVTIITIMRMW